MRHYSSNFVRLLVAIFCAIAVTTVANGYEVHSGSIASSYYEKPAEGGLILIRYDHETNNPPAESASLSPPILPRNAWLSKLLARVRAQRLLRASATRLEILDRIKTAAAEEKQMAENNQIDEAVEDQNDHMSDRPAITISLGDMNGMRRKRSAQQPPTSRWREVSRERVGNTADLEREQLSPNPSNRRASNIRFREPSKYDSAAQTEGDENAENDINSNPVGGRGTTNGYGDTEAAVTESAPRRRINYVTNSPTANSGRRNVNNAGSGYAPSSRRSPATQPPSAGRGSGSGGYENNDGYGDDDTTTQASGGGFASWFSSESVEDLKRAVYNMGIEALINLLSNIHPSLGEPLRKLLSGVDDTVRSRRVLNDVTHLKNKYLGTNQQLQQQDPNARQTESFAWDALLKLVGKVTGSK